MKKIKLLILLLFFGWSAAFAQDKRFITYKVKEGETIQSISKSLSVTPYDLLKLNPDVKDNVKVNDIIIIPNKQYDPLGDISNADLRGVGDKDIIVDKFIYHEVIPKETMYSITKSFDITAEELKENNRFLYENGLKIGQVIRIPLKIDDSELQAKEANTQPYLVKPKETKYSISKQFGITGKLRKLKQTTLPTNYNLVLGDFFLRDSAYHLASIWGNHTEASQFVSKYNFRTFHFFHLTTRKNL